MSEKENHYLWKIIIVIIVNMMVLCFNVKRTVFIKGYQNGNPKIAG